MDADKIRASTMGEWNDIIHKTSNIDNDQDKIKMISNVRSVLFGPL